MRISRSLLFTALLIVNGRLLLAQSGSTKVSIDLDSVKFQSVVTVLEQKSAIRFWYQDSLFANYYLSIHAHEQPLDSVLKQVFDDPIIRYQRYGNNIFVFKDRTLSVALPDGIFERVNSEKAAEPDRDASEYELKQERGGVGVVTIGRFSKTKKATSVLSGQVRHAQTGEPLSGVSVSTEGNKHVSTDAAGNFSIELARGKHLIEFHSLGMRVLSISVMLLSEGEINVSLSEEIVALKEVTIVSDREARINSTQMGVEKLDIKTIKKMSSALGEVDVLKATLTLPGVQSVGEAANGLNVRGGSTSQNLILLNDVPIYNSNHLFGFFSSFNPDVIKSIELHKAAIAPEFGGRVASFIELNTRDGNLKKFSGSGGISLLAGRLTLETPIFKGKASLLVAARTNYSNWLMKQTSDKDLNQSSAGFYDLNAGFHYRINENNVLDINAYQSRDQFQLRKDTVYHYGDKNISARWRHNFNSSFFNKTIVSYNEFENGFKTTANPVQQLSWSTSIKQWNWKTHFEYAVNDQFTVNAGLAATHYNLQPGQIQPQGAESVTKADQVESQKAVEAAVYLGAAYDLSPVVSISAGARMSSYYYLGPHSVYTYIDGLPKSSNTIVDTLNYGSGKVISHYGGFEPRASVRIALPKSSSLKFSYNRIYQYIQMISNTTTVAPTDTWKLSDPYVKPQIGDQVSLGYYKGFAEGHFDFSLEGYYKTTSQSIDAKNGAVLFMNKHIETDVIPTQGRAYGIEMMLRKNTGRLSGWITYTYARSLLKSTSNYAADVINNGSYYPSNYDKPHSANLVSNYRFTRRFSVNAGATYSTGRPITLPLAKYTTDGQPHIYYSDRNQYRIPDYFRIDLAITMEGNHKIKKLAHSSWTFSIYNLTGRHNVYSVFFSANAQGQIAGYQISVFARPIPTLTYNFKF